MAARVFNSSHGLTTGVVTNFASLAWSAAVSLALVPIYIRTLGLEAYGLIAFYLLLQSIFGVLDLGLSPALTRELARRSSLAETSGTRDLLRTIELGYWLLGCLIVGVTLAIAPFIAAEWIHPQRVAISVVEDSLRLMALALGLQWPISLYVGGLLGLRRQPLLSAITVAMVTFRAAGTIAVIALVSPTIGAFFVWQAVASLVHFLVIRTSLWRILPGEDHSARFSPATLKGLIAFAAGLSAITILGVLLTQLDKLAVSGLLSLSELGSYALGASLAGGLLIVETPLFSAYFPRFSSLVANGDDQSLRELYHQGCQLMSVAVLPLAITVSLFSYEVLYLWTGNGEVATHAAPVGSLLVLGTMLNGIMTLPYALQLAHGWTRIGLQIGLLLVAIMLPTLLFLTPRYGAAGAASAWPLVNAIYLVVGIPLTHAKLLKGEQRRWVLEDVGLPLVATLVSVVLVRVLFLDETSRLQMAVAVSASFLAAFGLSVVVSTRTRRLLFASIMR